MEEAEILDLIRAEMLEIGKHCRTMVPLPYKGGPVEAFNRYIDFAVCCYATKIVEFCEGMLDNFEKERYGVSAHCCRAIVENTAVLHHLVLDEGFIFLQAAWRFKAPLDLELRTASDRLYKFTHGNMFQWDAWVDGDLDALTAKARPSAGSVAQVPVGRVAVASLIESEPVVRMLYNQLSDMVHPNAGSNMLVLTSKNGRVACGGNSRGDAPRQQARHVMHGTGLVLAFCRRDLATLTEFKLI